MNRRRFVTAFVTAFGTALSLIGLKCAEAQDKQPLVARLHASGDDAEMNELVENAQKHKILDNFIEEENRKLRAFYEQGKIYPPRLIEFRAPDYLKTHAGEK